MIKIVHNEIDKISLKYFKAIDKIIVRKLTDYEEVLLAVYEEKGKSVKDFISLSLREWNRKKKLLNALPAINITSQKDLSTWTRPVVIDNNKAHLKTIFKFFNAKSNRKKIILAKPDEHEKIITDTYSKLGINATNKSISETFFSKIINYKLITKQIAYNLTWGLNIRACPYCNRIWINTVRNKKTGIIRPALDHFYSQTDYPLLGLSFFNLVPSCFYCNSYLKGSKEFNTTTHIHPYKEGFDLDATFSFTFKALKTDISHPDNFEVHLLENPSILADKKLRIFGNSKRNIGNVPTFELEAIYQVHRDLLGELYVKSDETNPYYATSIKDFIKQLVTSKEEFYKFHFHNYYEDENMNLRPLSKFTKDIILKRIPELR